MKSLWFVLVGMLVVFTLFFIMFTDWSLDSLLKKSSPEKIQQPISTHTKAQDNTINTRTITTHTTTSDISNKHNEIKDNTEQNIQKELPEDELLYKEEISEAYLKKTDIKTIKKPIEKLSIVSIDGVTKVKMKIKAKEKDGVVKAKVAISHDMLTYAQAEKKGREANFITHIAGVVGTKIVYDVSASQFLSKNPLMKFSFQGKKGDILTIIYQDIKSKTFYDSKKIK